MKNDISADVATNKKTRNKRSRGSVLQIFIRYMCVCVCVCLCECGREVALWTKSVKRDESYLWTVPKANLAKRHPDDKFQFA